MTTPVSSQPSRMIDLGHGLMVTITESNSAAAAEGSAVVLLHGGAGPRSLAPLAAALAAHAYVITPVHPGFDGTPRPDWCDSIADLAVAYLDLLDVLDLRRVVVIGNSAGGWITAEMALRDTRGRLAGIVLIDAAGIDAPEAGRIVNPASVSPARLGELAFRDPALRPDPAALTAEQRAVLAVNAQTLALYGGPHFSHDPKLRRRLGHVAVPVLVIWGEDDGVAPLAYGLAYAASFPEAAFVAIGEAGHLPQIEQTGEVVAAISEFTGSQVKPHGR
jgi:pimeloyl-ACP methyl ester carboxylesterase